MTKKSNFLILMIFFTLPIVPTIALPYILPPSQVMGIMVNNFASIKTLTITQHTKIQDLGHENEMTFNEIVSLRSPFFYRSQIPNHPNKRLIIHNNQKTLRIVNDRITYDVESYDPMYRFFLLANYPNRLLEMLKKVGINTDKISLMRFEGAIAYLIGEKNKGSARLIVDKELFLPLILKYGDYQIRFSNYTEFMEDTWYPFQIVYSHKGEIIEEYTVMDIQANLPINVSLFDIPLIREKLIHRALEQ